MNYRIVRSDELYHHGVKGMRWGVRRNNRQSDSGADNVGKKQMSTAKKVAIGAGVAVGVGITIYAASKWRKTAIDNLSVDAIKTGKKYVRLSTEGNESAARIMNMADQAKLRGSMETMKFQQELANNTYRRAESLRNEGLDLIAKGQKKSFTNREVANEMKRMASKRVGGKTDYSKYRAPYKLTGYSKRGNRAVASFNKERFYSDLYKKVPSTKNWIMKDIYAHEKSTPMYSWRTHSGRPKKLKSR